MMKLKSIVSSIALLSGIALATPASATVVMFNLKNSVGQVIDTFTLDDTKGLPDAAGSAYVFFNLLSDLKGYNAVYFGTQSAPLGQLGIGNGQKVGNDYLVNQVITESFSPAFFSGNGVVPSFRFGTLTTRSGDVLTVTAVPELSTWSMLLCGFGLMGFALRGRAKPASGMLGRSEAGALI